MLIHLRVFVAELYRPVFLFPQSLLSWEYHSLQHWHKHCNHRIVWTRCFMNSTVPKSYSHSHWYRSYTILRFGKNTWHLYNIYIYIYIWRYICDTPPPPGRSGGGDHIYVYIYIYISPKKQTSLWNQAWLWLWHNTIGLSTWPKNPVGEIGLGTYWYSEQPVCKKSTWCRTSSSLSCYEYDHMCKGGSMPQPLERQVIYSQVCTTNGMYSRITHTWCMHLQR